MGILLDQAIQRLREQGGRVTIQRRLILESVETLAGHPTAEQIYSHAHVSDPALNLTTVYRTLHWLEREGLVSPQRFDGQQRQGRFDSHPPANHHHFLCVSCERVVEFNEPLTTSLVAKLQRQLHVHVDSASVLVRGWCEECWGKRIAVVADSYNGAEDANRHHRHHSG